MSAPGVWVVVPFHHRLELLHQALTSVTGLPTIVVDDSRQGLLQGGLDGVRVVRSSGEEGFARAANRGLEAAQAEGATRVLLLNDDAVIDAGALELLLAAMEPGVGAVGPLVMSGGAVGSAGFRLAGWGRLREHRRDPGATVTVDALSGACLLLGAGHRFDPRYRHGMEDIALCRELRAQGLELRLVAAARCQHLGGATVPRSSAEAQRHAVSGHLRLVGGGWRTPVVVGLAVAQVLREGATTARLAAVVAGLGDYRREG